MPIDVEVGAAWTLADNSAIGGSTDDILAIGVTTPDAFCAAGGISMTGSAGGNAPSSVAIGMIMKPAATTSAMPSAILRRSG